MLTQQMATLIERMAQTGQPPMHTLNAQAARAFYEKAGTILAGPTPAMCETRRLEILNRDGHRMPASLWVPTATARGVLLYFHGGGFTIGSAATHAGLCQQLAAQANCAVLSVDYRLAPEHPFPAAAHDAFDALSWLQTHHHTLSPGTDLLSHLHAVGGDSAGGTLAAASAIHARAQGWSLALQLLFYPGTGAHQDTASHQRFANGYVLTRADIDYFFRHYIPDYAMRTDWRFAPLLADDHSGLAPTWIGLAECDPLIDEGIAYGDALRSAGVSVDLEIYKGVVHGFINWDRAIPEAKVAYRDASAALRRAFA